MSKGNLLSDATLARLNQAAEREPGKRPPVDPGRRGTPLMSCRIDAAVAQEGGVFAYTAKLRIAPSDLQGEEIALREDTVSLFSAGQLNPGDDVWAVFAAGRWWAITTGVTVSDGYTGPWNVTISGSNTVVVANPARAKADLSIPPLPGYVLPTQVQFSMTAPPPDPNYPNYPLMAWVFAVVNSSNIIYRYGGYAYVPGATGLYQTKAYGWISALDGSDLVLESGDLPPVPEGTLVPLAHLSGLWEDELGYYRLQKELQLQYGAVLIP